jgi:hypothetical protein
MFYLKPNLVDWNWRALWMILLKYFKFLISNFCRVLNNVFSLFFVILRRLNFVWYFGALCVNTCLHGLWRRNRVFTENARSLAAISQSPLKKRGRNRSTIKSSLNKPVCGMWTLLFCSAPHLSLTIKFSPRILQSADILYVPSRPLFYTIN